MIHTLGFTKTGIENNKELILQGYQHIQDFETKFLRSCNGDAESEEPPGLYYPGNPGRTQRERIKVD
jgi:hypothetical protein